MEHKNLETIRRVEFDKLTNSEHYAFCDVTSASSLVRNMEELTISLKNEPIYSKLKNKITQSVDFQNTLAILERLIAYEKLVFDEVGMKSIIIGDLDEQLPLEITSIPDHIYKDTASIIHSLMHDDIYKLLQSNNMLFSEEDGYKDYFDNLYEKLPIEISTIAGTGPTLPRILFYLILSENCSAPLFLSPSKDEILNSITGVSVSDLLKDIEIYTDKVLLGEINELVSKQIVLPPLSYYVLETAYRKKISLLESMLFIRETKDAKKFREWLHCIQINIAEGTRAGIIDAKKQITQLQKTIDKWAENMDIGLDVTHKYTPIGVGICTGILKKIGIDIKLPSLTFEVKDPILNPPRHLKFIASWYKAN